MTTHRHYHYKHALGLIGRLDPRRIGSASSLLRDLAQDLLLSREATVESDDLADQVRITLDGMLSRHEIPGWMARELWSSIYSCGPGATAPIIEPTAVGAAG